MPWPLFGGFLLLQMEEDRQREDLARRSRDGQFRARQLPLAGGGSASSSGGIVRSVVSVRGS